MPRTKSNTLPKILSCAKCGEPYSANPPDDIHTLASLDSPVEGEIDLLMTKAVPYACPNCNEITTLYWIDRDRFRLEQLTQGGSLTEEELKSTTWVELRCRECGKSNSFPHFRLFGNQYLLICDNDTCRRVLGVVRRTNSGIFGRF